MQAVDPWKGHREGFKGYMNTMRYLGEKRRQENRDAEEDRRYAEQKARQNEMDAMEKKKFEYAMLENSFQTTAMGLKMLQGIEDTKSYDATMKVFKKIADSQRKISPQAGEMMDKFIADMPEYDGELAADMMGTMRKNPDSKFVVWQRQKELETMAMLKMLGGKMEPYKQKGFHKINKDGSVTNYESTSPEDEASLKEMGAERGKHTAKKEKDPSTAMAAWLKKNPNATEEEIIGFAEKLNEAQGSNSKSSKGKMIDEYFNLDPKDPDYEGKKKIYEAEFVKRGIKIITDGDGNTTIVTNAAQDGSTDLTTANETNLNQDLLNANKQFASVYDISNKFKPEYQTLGVRWKALESGIREKLKGTPLDKLVDTDISKEDKAMLSEYSEYRRTAIANVNDYIKLITGAQMSEAEAKRLMKAMPNPGMGLFDGDSPTEFKAKLDGVMKDLQRSIARYNYVRKNGMKINDVTLGEVDGLIKKRVEEIKTKATEDYPEYSKDLINITVKNQIMDEFGLRFE